jgi:Uma2 family endonuclease
MAENTLQYEWIVTIKGNLDILFFDRSDVFVAGDLLWYPVEGEPKIRTAPDVMVAFGRPKGYRGSYKQWEEAGIPPHVVFEILSPGNRTGEMMRKFKFYERFGVCEYYICDPELNSLVAYHRIDGELIEVDQVEDLISPRLGIRFESAGGTLRIFDPADKPFLGFSELGRLASELAEERDELAHKRDELARQRDRERQRAEQLEARLRELGVELPDA